MAQQPQASPAPAHVATLWADLTVQIMTRAPKNTPTYGSRALGYLGLTMYETAIAATARQQSVAPYLSAGLVVPQLRHRRAYCPELAVNAAQAHMLRALYAYTGSTARIDSMAAAVRAQYAARCPAKMAEQSEQHGIAVAEAICRWSCQDGGDEGYQRNFPKDYVLVAGKGMWTPPHVGQTTIRLPMHPSWGQNRVFVPGNTSLPMPKPLAYSTDTASRYYQEFNEVYTRNANLTEAEREVVMWWGDDPNLTCSPPGHSYHLATLAIRTSNASLSKAAETYARVGMAVADAFVVCWKTKFTYLVERPAAYIKEHIVSTGPVNYRRWYPFFLEPPFPSFYSGHATQSAAMATVLTDLYGDSFAFLDDTHVSRAPLTYIYKSKFKTINFAPRPYASFWAAARECAESRLLGGIHTRYDNEVGLAEGTKIGTMVNALPWGKKR